MSTGGALQHLLDHVKGLNKKMFATTVESITDRESATSFLGESIEIVNGGFSTTTHRSLHFMVDLGAFQPPDVSEFNIWVNNAKEDDLLRIRQL